MKLLFRFRMGCHHLPKDEGSWSKPKVPRLERVWKLCTIGTIDDEQHLLFECPELDERRGKWASQFSGFDTVLQEFIWQKFLEFLVVLVRCFLNF